MKKINDWSDIARNRVAENLRRMAKDAPAMEASYLRELATAIDND